MDEIIRNSIIEYAGKSISLHDYTGISDEIYVKTIEENVKISEKIDNREQLLLLDITNSYISTNVLEAFKKASIDTKPFTKKIAVIGVKGIQKVFFNLVLAFSKSNSIKSFRTKEDAIEWLVKP